VKTGSNDRNAPCEGARQEATRVQAIDRVGEEAQLERDGYVILHDVMPGDMVSALARAFDELMAAKVARSGLRPASPTDRRAERNDGVLIDFRPEGGNHDLNRWNMHLPSRLPFLDDRLLANPSVTSLVEGALGADCILGIIASDTPFPGSGFQTVHQDDVLPRLTLNVPLVDVGPQNAPIEIWPGTHVRAGEAVTSPWRVPTRWGGEAIAAHVRAHEPVRIHLQRGSVLLRDHRLLHRGTPNRSVAPRPMLSLLFFPRPQDVPPRALLDEVARLALDRREAARRGSPFDHALLDRANALGRHVEYQGGSDRDYRRRIPRPLFDALSAPARRLLRLASLDDGDAPCDDVQRTAAAAHRLREIVQRHDAAVGCVSGATPLRALQAETLGGRAHAQLRGLCSVAGFGDRTRVVLDQMGVLAGSWSQRPLGEAPRWSGFSDDCTPYEMSVVLGTARPEVRVGFEVQSATPSPLSYWDAGLAMNREIARRFGVDLTAFERLQDLFRPTSPDAFFAMWHGVCFWPDSPPAFKLYLNPYGKGFERGSEVLAAALDRLGFPRAIPELVARMRPGLDQFLGLGIDLSSELGGRAKVYLRTRRAPEAHLAELMSLAGDARPDEAVTFAKTVTGCAGSFDRRPLQVCYAFLDPSGGGARPDRATLLVPPITYATNDAVIRDRVALALERFGGPVDLYRRYAAAFAPEAPERDRGAHGYVSLQWEKGRPRLTSYFYGRAFRDRFGEVDPRRPWPSPHTAYREVA
jgi:DMATS type aromatic prenyltransferase